MRGRWRGTDLCMFKVVLHVPLHSTCCLRARPWIACACCSCRLCPLESEEGTLARAGWYTRYAAAVERWRGSFHVRRLVQRRYPYVPVRTSTHRDAHLRLCLFMQQRAEVGSRPHFCLCPGPEVGVRGIFGVLPGPLTGPAAMLSSPGMITTCTDIERHASLGRGGFRWAYRPSHLVSILSPVSGRACVVALLINLARLKWDWIGRWYW